MTLSVSSFFSAVRKRVTIPDTTSDIGSSADLLLFTQEELQNHVYQFITSLYEEFFIVKEVLPLQTSTQVVIYPNGVIPLPKRMWGRSIREIKYVDTDDTITNIPQIMLNDDDVLTPMLGYHFLTDGIKLLADMDSLNGSIELHYTVSPSTLVNSATLHAPITSLSFIQPQVVVFGTPTASVGADLSTYCPDAQTKLFDLYRVSTGALLAINIKATRQDIVATGQTFFAATGAFTEADAKEISMFQEGGFFEAGNTMNTAVYTPELYLVPAGQLGFTPIPSEADNYLVQTVSGRVLEALSDTEGLQVNEAKVNQIRDHLVHVLGTRSTNGETRKVVNRRGLRQWLNHSFLRGRRW